ncbi:rubrerythrin [Anaerosolibacter carboniphilus]|uniref:Rubrerythrin n=1 Tax=Anaerosolibacter carboniphilus TaxID=1417629 RepID=A0A841KXY5_9FIRM|nr:ferritin-like domain-containing protein [Anaerosolibacter carboniphilus]MBB6218616.1 rubrerythrin [Anaerosolibacter carboniphilus]
MYREMHMGYGYNTPIPYDPAVLGLIQEAMKDERHDRVKYGKMLEMTDDKKVQEQIRFAYEDEGKHYTMFQKIYAQLTGQRIEIPVPRAEDYGTLQNAIETSIDGELEAVELYRRIKAMLPTRQMQDDLYEIITDEQEHATRFVYLYAMEK